MKGIIYFPTAGSVIVPRTCLHPRTCLLRKTKSAKVNATSIMPETIPFLLLLIPELRSFKLIKKISMEQTKLFRSFHLFGLTFLTLLLPLSFLLISRMANFRHHGYPAIPESILFEANSVLLHALLTIVSLSTFLHGLTENTIALGHKVPPIVLCALLASVDLGLEHNIASATSGTHLINFKDGTIILSLSARLVLFLLGLYETMIHWSNLVVKPVVDDMVFVSLKEGNKVVEKVVMTVSCGAMWWWMLRDEVVSMVLGAELRKGAMVDGVSDLIFWWLYFATLFIGIVKIVKCLFWVGLVLASCKGESEYIEQHIVMF